MRVYVCMSYRSAHVELRGQLEGVTSFLLSREFQGLNSGQQGWPQALLTEPLSAYT